MIYGYARVSTQGQAKEGNGLEVQEAALKATSAEQIYKDVFTGTRTDRPEFDKLRSIVIDGDTIIVMKLDHIARSVRQGIEFVDEMNAKGVRINILNMGILDNTPNGKLMRNIMFSFAEFERDMIVQRTQEGKAVARTKPSFTEGRPKKLDKRQRERVVALLEDRSYSEVSEMTHISKSTLQRYKREL